MLLYVSLEIELTWPIYFLLFFPDVLFADAVRPEIICEDRRPYEFGADSFLFKFLIEAELELVVRKVVVFFLVANF